MTRMDCRWSCTSKMKKTRKPGGGRKKLKPEYDAGKNLKEQMESAVALYDSEMSLQAIADALALNPIKVRKLLITAGVYESEVAEKVQATFQGYRETQDYKTSMGNAEERAFITGDGVGKPLGLLAETGGAKVGVTAAQKDAVSFDEIFKLYYALKAPYRKKAQFLCNEALVLQLMTIKDNNGNYIWKPGLEIGKPDTLLNRPLKTSAFMPEIKGGSKVMAFGDYSYYWVADRQNRTFRRLNELYARTDQVGFLTTQRVDGKLILPEAVQLLQMAPQG